MKKPEKPVTVPAKSSPAYAAPIEKTKPIAAEVNESKPALDIKLPDTEPMRDTVVAKPQPAAPVAKPEVKPVPETKPTPAPAKPKETPGEKVATDEQPAPAAAGPKKHLVVKGDTLFNISRRYGLTVAELRSLNNLSEADAIKLGMELIVSK